MHDVAIKQLNCSGTVTEAVDIAPEVLYTQLVLAGGMNVTFEQLCELLMRKETTHVDKFNIFKQYIYMPFIVTLGLFGNIMALMMIKDHKALRRLASSNYLVTVAISSITVLCCLALYWLQRMTHAMHFTNVQSKILLYFTHTADFICVWAIVMICIDRMCVLYKGLPGRSAFRSVHSARRICFCILSIAMVYNIWVPIAMRPDSSVSDHRFYNYCVVAETVITCAIPAVLMIVTNIATIYRYNTVMAHMWKVRFLPGNDNTTTLHATTHETRVTPYTLQEDGSPMRVHACKCDYSNTYYQEHDEANDNKKNENRVAFQCDPNASLEDAEEHAPLSHNQIDTPPHGSAPASSTMSPASDGSRHISKQSRLSITSIKQKLNNYRRTSLARPCEVRLTKMLVTITSLYLLMNVPNYYIRLNNVFYNLKEKRTIDGTEEFWVYELVQQLAFMLFYAHYALLFYFYVFWSPDQKSKMRHFAMRILQCYCFMPEAQKHAVKDLSHY